jgi:hypothetical protein
MDCLSDLVQIRLVYTYCKYEIQLLHVLMRHDENFRRIQVAEGADLMTCFQPPPNWLGISWYLLRVLRT